MDELPAPAVVLPGDLNVLRLAAIPGTLLPGPLSWTSTTKEVAGDALRLHRLVVPAGRTACSISLSALRGTKSELGEEGFLILQPSGPRGDVCGSFSNPQGSLVAVCYEQQGRGEEEKAPALLLDVFDAGGRLLKTLTFEAGQVQRSKGFRCGAFSDDHESRYLVASTGSSVCLFHWRAQQGSLLASFSPQLPTEITKLSLLSPASSLSRSDKKKTEEIAAPTELRIIASGPGYLRLLQPRTDPNPRPEKNDSGAEDAIPALTITEEPLLWKMDLSEAGATAAKRPTKQERERRRERKKGNEAEDNEEDSADRGFNFVDHALIFPLPAKGSAATRQSGHPVGFRLVAVAEEGDVFVLGLGNGESADWSLLAVLPLRIFLRDRLRQLSGETSNNGGEVLSPPRLSCVVPSSTSAGVIAPSTFSSGSTGDEGGFVVMGSDGLVAFFERESTASSLAVKSKGSFIVPFSPGHPYICVRALLLPANAISKTQGGSRIAAAALSADDDTLALATSDRGLLLLSRSQVEEDCLRPSGVEGASTVYPHYPPLLPFVRVNELSRLVLSEEDDALSGAAAVISSGRASAGFLSEDDDGRAHMALSAALPPALTEASHRHASPLATFGGSHSGAISSLSLASTSCVPRMLTCSKEDGTIRAWNWLYGTCEAVEVTATPPSAVSLGVEGASQANGQPNPADAVERPISVALHPSGLLSAASFPSSLHLFDLTCSTGLFSSSSTPADTAVVSSRGGGLSSRASSASRRGGAGGGIARTFPAIRNASVLAYSPAGSFLAVAVGSHLTIYNSFIMEPLHSSASLHSSATSITDLAWSKNEAFVATVAADGGIALFSVKEGKKSDDYSTVLKSAAFTCCCVVSQPSLVASLTPASQAKGPAASLSLSMSMGAGNASARGVIGTPYAPTPPAGVTAVVAAGEAKDGSGFLMVVLTMLPSGEGTTRITKIRTSSRITRLVADFPSPSVLSAVTSALNKSNSAILNARSGDPAFSPVALLQALVQPRRLFAGTENGELVVYRFPFAVTAEPKGKTVTIALGSPLPHLETSSAVATAAGGGRRSNQSSPQGSPRTPPPPAAASASASTTTGGGSATTSPGMLSPTGFRAGGAEGRSRRGSNASAESFPSTILGGGGGGEVTAAGRTSRSGSIASSGAAPAAGTRAQKKQWQEGLRRQGSTSTKKATTWRDTGSSTGKGRESRAESTHHQEPEEEEGEDLFSFSGKGGKLPVLHDAHEDPVHHSSCFPLHRGAITGLAVTDDGRNLISVSGARRIAASAALGAGSGNKGKSAENFEADGSIFVLGLPYATNESVEALLGSLSPSAAMVAIARENTAAALTTRPGSKGMLPRFILRDGQPAPSLPPASLMSPLNYSLAWNWFSLVPRLSCLFHNVTTLPRYYFEELSRRLLRAGEAIAEVKEHTRRRISKMKEEGEFKLSRCKDEADRELQQEKRKVLRLQSDLEALRAQSAKEKLEQKKEAEHYLAETCNVYERRLKLEITRYQGLHKEMREVKAFTEETLTAAEKERKSQLQAVVDAATKRYRQQVELITKLQDALRQREVKAAALLDEADREADEEANKIRATMEAAKQAETTKLEASEMQVRQLTRSNKALTASQKEAQDDLSSVKADLRAMQTLASTLERERAILRKQVEDLEVVTAAKDRDIGSLKSEIRELSTFKFVLTHQLREMEEDREPLLQQMHELKGKVQGQGDELFASFESNKAKEREKKETAWRMTSLQNEAKKLRLEVREAKRRLDTAIAEIDRVARGPEAGYREGVLGLMRKFVLPSGTAAAAADKAGRGGEGEAEQGQGSGGLSPSAKTKTTISLYEHEQIVEELLRHQKHLEKRLGLQVTTKTADVERSERAFRKVQAESLKTLEEGNALRQEVTYQRRWIAHLEATKGGRRAEASSEEAKGVNEASLHSFASEARRRTSALFAAAPSTSSFSSTPSPADNKAASLLGPNPLTVLPLSRPSSASAARPSQQTEASSSNLSLLRQAPLFPSPSLGEDRPSIASSWKDLNSSAQRYYNLLGASADSEVDDERRETDEQQQQQQYSATNEDRSKEVEQGDENEQQQQQGTGKERRAKVPAGLMLVETSRTSSDGKGLGGGAKQLRSPLSSLILGQGKSLFSSPVVPLSPTTADISSLGGVFGTGADKLSFSSSGSTSPAAVNASPLPSMPAPATVSFSAPPSRRPSIDSAGAAAMESARPSYLGGLLRPPGSPDSTGGAEPRPWSAVKAGSLLSAGLGPGKATGNNAAAVGTRSTGQRLGPSFSTSSLPPATSASFPLFGVGAGTSKRGAVGGGGGERGGGR